ncbi:hypothetical protein [Nonomuraea roseoviolacea]|uniref:Uncharacterized protein n=1 Tax=Nonomuraea roseoviolacea subsp. carminata TaxID=160689 RepID=A0ABT1K810_9ACTN|nr:hypothetical protein [Nonomuraea roseoviolacea]MCP2350138.1 hypothetical protein [Nonomuraea roseoviolacea subsp. carminata]
MSVPAEHASMTPLPVLAAERLQTALKDHGIAADVHDGYGLALVSVWVGLVVWCDCDRYWWRAGWDIRRKSVVYAWHAAVEPVRAARRVAFRYAELHSNHSYSEVIADLASSTRCEDGSVR